MCSFSLWVLETESIYTITAIKAKDTNSEKVVEDWMNKGDDYVASRFMDVKEINAADLHIFNSVE